MPALLGKKGAHPYRMRLLYFLQKLATSYSPRHAGPLPPPTAPGILCSSRNSNCRFNHFSTAADLPRRARWGATDLDNLGAICAQLPTGAGGSPFAFSQPRTDHRKPQPHPQPSFNRLSDSDMQSPPPTLQQPRSNHPSCRNRVVRGVDIFNAAFSLNIAIFYHLGAISYKIVGIL